MAPDKEITIAIKCHPGAAFLFGAVFAIGYNELCSAIAGRQLGNGQLKKELAQDVTKNQLLALYRLMEPHLEAIGFPLNDVDDQA